MNALMCQPYLQAMSLSGGQKCTIVSFPNTHASQTLASDQTIIEYPEYSFTVDYDIQSITVIYLTSGDTLDVGAIGIAAADVTDESTMYYTSTTGSNFTSSTSYYYLKTINHRTVYPAFGASKAGAKVTSVSRVAAALLFG